MNKIEEFERDLKVAYLNYENNDLNETLKYLDRMLETILKEDKTLENDPFWKNLTCDVFKAIVLNNFYNKVELTGNDLDSLLGNEEQLKKTIKEFCENFRNNELIDFVSHIENIADNPLKEVIKILMSNMGRMNIADIKIEINNNDTNSKIQVIECFCGKTFEFDWSKIPNTDKFIYVRCPFCDSERKLKNMYFEDNDNKDKNSLEDDNINLMDVVKYAQELFSLKYKYCIIEKEEYIYHLLYVDNRLLNSEFGGHTFRNYYYDEEVISFLGTQSGLLKNPIPMSYQRYQVDVDEVKTEVKQLDSFKCQVGLWIKGEDYTICYNYPPFSTNEKLSLESKYNIPFEMRGKCYVFEILKNSDSKRDISYWDKIVNQTLIFLKDKQNHAIEYFIKKLYEENSIHPKYMLDFFKNLSVKPDIMKEFLFAYTNSFHFDDIIEKNNLTALNLSVLDFFRQLVEKVQNIYINEDIIEVINNQNSKNTYEIKKNLENIVTTQNVSYLENNQEVREKKVVFVFTIIDINEEYITIKTNPMCEVINGKINLNNPKTEFKLYKNLELTLATPTMDRENTYKLSVKSKKVNSLEKYPDKSFGIFVDIKDLENLKIYSHTYTNKYGNDPKRYSPIDNIVLPEEIATNWIIENKNFKIIKENISIWHGNNHDEEHYVEKLVYETNFHYSIGDFMSFVCEKDGEQFTLIPSSKWIKINDEDYNIPEIEIHNYDPEKLGLININKLDIK